MLRSAVRGVVEALECRKYLSIVPAGDLFFTDDGVQAIRMDWHNQKVNALAGRWIVQLDNYDGTRARQQTDVSRALQKYAPAVSLMQWMGADGLFLVNAPLSLTSNDVVKRLGKLPGFEYAEPDFLYQLQRTPNDTRYAGNMWGLNNTGQTGGTAGVDVDAPEAWEITTGSSQMVVGMVDSGIDLTHPDLAANVWVNPFEIAGNLIDDEGNGYVDDINGYDWWGDAVANGAGDSVPADQNDHGSHTAGTVGAVGNNSTGVVGINWSVKLMGLKIGGSGSSVSGADAVMAMNYVADMRDRGVNIRVTSHSWGGGSFSASMDTAIANHATRGIIFCAAAGNGGADLIGDNNDVTPFYPATYTQPNIISVGNHTQTNTRNSSSNFGATTVDLFAPGTNIDSTVRVSSGSYNNTFTGTSMSTPHVAGAVALAFNVHTGSGYTTVKDAIMTTTTAGAAYSGISVSGGRLNVNSVLEKLVFNLTGGVLTITGTISDDLITLNYDGVNVSATVGPASGVSSRTKTYSAASVSSIVVLSQSGNDTINVTNTETNSPISIDAGTGTDTISVLETASGSPVTIVSSTGDDTVSVNTGGTGAATAIFDATQRLGSLSIASGGLASLNAAGNRFIRTNALSVTGTGKLDLFDNDLIFDYTGPSQLSAVQTLINAGRNFGDWLGNGMTSTSARNHPQQITTLGAMEANDYLAYYGAGTPFAGETLNSTMALVKYTYYGDSNMSGKVDLDDYANSDGGFLLNLTGWLNGDFDGSGGKADLDDYSLIDAAYLTQGAPL
ncbi:MAG: S8 family serine peptidase [Tepidisphaeraceae bacterium]